MFKAAKQNRIFQDVVEQIQETILSGKLKPGEMLPSERELKAMLQVSRGTLREALRVLEQKGLIEIKLGVGGGAVVQDVSYDQMNESLALLIRYQKVSLRHLSEFRLGVEGRVSALAAARATPADIIRLKSMLEQARQLSKKELISRKNSLRWISRFIWPWRRSRATRSTSPCTTPFMTTSINTMKHSSP
jgi:DNA-binding FadR family transcriptional regulator